MLVSIDQVLTIATMCYDCLAMVPGHVGARDFYGGLYIRATLEITGQPSDGAETVLCMNEAVVHVSAMLCK